MTTAPQHDQAQLFARVARELAAGGGLRATLERITGMARTLTGCDSVTLWVFNRDQHPGVSAATDPAHAETHAKAVRQIAEGVDWDCLHTRSVVTVVDIRAETRWPDFAQLTLAYAEPFLSFLALPLSGGEGETGALVLASRQPGHFNEDLVRAGSIYAEHAWLAARCAAGEEEAGNLKLALESNRRIGIALGIVMAGRRCTDIQAFDQLREASQNRHLKLRELAEDIILTGSLPQTPARAAPLG
jgi:GAF domain-containing protein